MAERLDRPDREKISNILHNIKASKLIPSEDNIRQILALIPDVDKGEIANEQDLPQIKGDTCHICEMCGLEINPEIEWIRSGSLKAPTRYYHSFCAKMYSKGE